MFRIIGGIILILFGATSFFAVFGTGESDFMFYLGVVGVSLAIILVGAMLIYSVVAP